jgi:predicted AAA+ superfamily ATPase
MIRRDFWINRIQEAWKFASLIWLTGVRRVGKTTLAHSLGEIHYLNCDLQDVARALEKPESFFPTVQKPVVVLDEVHQLVDPSRVLKIGADEFPHLKILATGSSTLAATQKFRDSLTGRKRTVQLAPVLYAEMSAFGITDIRHRLLRGGLPQALLAPQLDRGFYAEWLDSYFSRDVQELFKIGKRSGFLKLFDLLMRQSGGLAEITTLSKLSGLTRPTVMNYLDVFEVTHVLHAVRPFHGNGRQEILKQPKLYAFDTGFVCYNRGWKDVRDEDGGLLWEHLTLDALRTIGPAPRIHYWRDKSKREVDFVLPLNEQELIGIECKWNDDYFRPDGFKALRALHPKGANYLVTPFVTHPYDKTFGEILVHVLPLDRLLTILIEKNI